MQNIINAFENDKIKDPINNIEELYDKLKFTTLSIEEVSKIIGMAISFNTKYATRNKNHSIKHIDIIVKLSEYYNPDGSFKYNENIKEFESLMQKLFSNIITENQSYNYIFSNTSKNIQIEDFVNLLISSNEQLKNTSTEVNKNNSTRPNLTISQENIEAMQELKKYYKNGKIIEIPKDLNKFYDILEKCGLDDKEKAYIIGLINEQKSIKMAPTIFRYLSEEEQATYQKALNLLNSFTHSNADAYALKQYIEELQTISNMLETESDVEYLLSEVPSIIRELSAICQRYTIEDKESTNKFIFLLNKDLIPYIYDDIESIDPTYRKAIYSLISKIAKINESQFAKIFNNEELPYCMHEVRSPRGHIAFVEIQPEIYIIIGANTRGNGYKEFNNRLKANIQVIKQIENSLKDPKIKSQILQSNEEYLTIFNEKKDNPNKRALKPSN